LLVIGCIAGSIMTGAVTALTGPIAFVGLIVPHALRMWVGADHRILAPSSFLLGAAFVALCDVVSRTILAPVEIPVGVITALLGGPFFIWMLSSRRRGISL
jgi:iron complex transport system permease protein